MKISARQAHGWKDRQSVNVTDCYNHVCECPYCSPVAAVTQILTLQGCEDTLPVFTSGSAEQTHVFSRSPSRVVIVLPLPVTFALCVLPCHFGLFA